MIKISEVANSVRPSLTRKLFNMAKEYDNVIDFTLGDPDIPTADGIKAAACAAIHENKTRYSQNAGVLSLREAISNYNKVKEGLHYEADSEIIVTVGAMEGLYLSLLALIDEGDEVIIPAPYYVNYVQMVNMCHGKPIVVENHEDPLRISIDAIKAALTSRTKLILLNTPSNPTGKVVTANELNEIALIAKEKDILVVTDEVYKCLIYNGIRPQSIASLPDMKERVIYINSMSKEFCMTGWRLGYVMGPKEIIAAMTKLQENVVACAPLPSQYAAIEAMRTDVDYSANMAMIFARRRDVLVDEFRKITKLHCLPPESTFYAMVDISKTGMKSEEFAYELLKAVQVAVVPGVTYGKMCDNYVRLAFTLNEDKIIEGIRRIGKFADSL